VKRCGGMMPNGWTCWAAQGHAEPCGKAFVPPSDDEEIARRLVNEVGRVQRHLAFRLLCCRDAERLGFSERLRHDEAGVALARGELAKALGNLFGAPASLPEVNHDQATGEWS
jgi:hypothetical protein